MDFATSSGQNKSKSPTNRRETCQEEYNLCRTVCLQRVLQYLFKILQGHNEHTCNQQKSHSWFPNMWVRPELEHIKIKWFIIICPIEIPTYKLWYPPFLDKSMWNGMFKATKPNAAESSHLLRETGCKALERPAPLHPPLSSPTQPRYGWQCQDNTLEGSKPSVERHKETRNR